MDECRWKSLVDGTDESRTIDDIVAQQRPNVRTWVSRVRLTRAREDVRSEMSGCSDSQSSPSCREETR